MWKIFQRTPLFLRQLIVGFVSCCVLLLLIVPVLAQKDTGTVKLPPKPKGPTTGTLVLSSDPADADAEIYLDNKSQGRTTRESKEIALKPGNYLLEVKHPEYLVFRKKITIRVGDVQPVLAILTPKNGTLLFSATDIKPGTIIELDGKAYPEADWQRDKDNNVRLKTSFGEHTVQVKGYLAKKINLTIEEAIVPVLLERELTTLIVQTLPKTRVYINGEASGEVPTTGELKISLPLPAEQLKVLLELDGYETYQTLLNPAKQIPLAVNLMPLPTSAEFADTFFNLSLWNAPKEWKVEKGLLQVRGAPGLGLPKDKLYRNCEIVFGLRLAKTRGAAWVVHAKDEKNYYLFYLNGPSGPFPNQFTTYICRDGVLNLNEPASAPQPVPSLTEKEDYRIRIRVVDNTIEHWLTPSKAGEDIKIGFYEDPNNNFSYGNAGFSVLNGEEFLINGFAIRPLPDTKAKSPSDTKVKP
ncbi:MAG: PEGA domain-containing protein [Acidobacteriota bacterium]